MTLRRLSAVLFLSAAFATPASAETSTDTASSYCKKGMVEEPEICSVLRNADEMVGTRNTVDRWRFPPSYLILARYGDEWSVMARRVVHSWSKDTDSEEHTVETRDITRVVDAELVERLKARLDAEFIAELDATPYYPDDKICIHGESLAVVVNLPDKAGQWRRHSCSGPTKLDELRDAIREIVFETDPVMARFTDVRQETD